MRTLIVEDDFTNRILLQTMLSRYGECHVAVNGREAVDAVRHAINSGYPYQLVCMDIVMPEMNGLAAVECIRELEQARGIQSTAGVKIIMATASTDVQDVGLAFHELCDAYLVKPVNTAQLVNHLKSMHLVT